MHDKTPAIAACCATDGTVTEVLQNRLKLEDCLTTGQPFARIAGTSSRPKMLGFIRKIVDSGAALDWELDIASKHGIVPLFFSGCRVKFGIIIIASAKSRPPKELELQLLRFAGKERSERLVVKKTLDLEEQKVETFRNLGMIVHALRNPANGILTAAEYLIDEPSCGVTEESRPLLESVIRSSQFMLQLIEEILDISACECGKLKVDLRPTDLVSLVEHDLLLNATQLGLKKLRLNKHWERPAIVVNLDPIKITQVIDNLVHNAIKFSPLGGSIDIRLATRGEAVTLSVRDEGPGLSAEAADTIWDPFQSSRDGSQSIKAGTGLGLAISKRIIEAPGGQISVKSDFGTGATFSLTFPLTAAQACSAIREVPTKTARTRECARHHTAGSRT